jgi:hypothetical protein
MAFMHRTCSNQQAPADILSAWHQTGKRFPGRYSAFHVNALSGVPGSDALANSVYIP